jgi:hypothetical protein
MKGENVNIDKHSNIRIGGNINDKYKDTNKKKHQF